MTYFIDDLVMDDNSYNYTSSSSSSSNSSSLSEYLDVLQDNNLTAENEFANSISTIVVFITFIISVFGVLTNIINVSVFHQLKDTESCITFSMIGLTCSDLFVCGSQLIGSLGLLLILMGSGAEYLLTEDYEMVNYFALIPNSCFIKCTIMVTVVITVERYLCVAFPLTAKHMVNPTDSTVIISGIFFLSGVSVIPFYYVNRPVPEFDPVSNKTLYVIRRYHKEVNHWYEPLNAFIFYVALFMSIVLATLGIINNIRRASKWRKESGTDSDKSNSRGNKIAKMVILLSALFTICYLPSGAFLSALAISDAFDFFLFEMKYWTDLSRFVCYLIQTLNSALNVFIYYKTHMGYHKIFCRMFGIKPMASAGEVESCKSSCGGKPPAKKAGGGCSG